MNSGKILSKAVWINYAGALCTGLIGLLAAPTYYRILGKDSWGIVATCLSMQAFVFLIDAGISQVVIKSTSKNKMDFNALSKSVSNILFIYLFISLVFGFFGFLIIPTWVTDYLGVNSANFDIYTGLAKLMLFFYVFQYVNGFFVGVMHGAGLQLLANGSGVAFLIAKHAVSIFLISLGLGVYGYAFGMLSVSLFEMLFNFYRVSKYVSIKLSFFSIFEVRNILFDISGLSAVVFVGALVSQLDKIILPGKINPDLYGKYVIVSGLGLAFLQLQYPIMKALMPARSEKGFLTEDERSKVNKYLGLFCLLPAVFVICFANWIVEVWLGVGDQVLSNILRCVVLGCVFNAFYGVDYVGFVSDRKYLPIFVINVINLVISLFLFVFFVPRFGIVVAGFSWLLTCMVQFAFGKMLFNKCKV